MTEQDDDPKTWRDLAEAAIADLRSYANDELPHRRLVSAEAYEERAALLSQGSAALPSEAPVCAACKGSRGDLPDGREPEELCDCCYGDVAVRAATPTAPVQDDDAEWLRKLSACVSSMGGEYTWREVEDRLERIVSRLSPTPDTGLIEALREALLFVEKMEARDNTHYLIGGKIAEALANAALAQPESLWQSIEDMRWPIETPVIVTDGLSVYGAGWWHPGEQAWIDCGGITPTLWQWHPKAPGAGPMSRPNQATKGDGQ